MQQQRVGEATRVRKRGTQVESQAHILVVDDEAAVRLTLGALLELDGYRVTLAGSGAEAVALLLEHPCDVVVLDLIMPDRPGGGVAAPAARLQPELPVIFLTGHGLLESPTDIPQDRSFAYLLKTCDPRIVLDCVAAALRLRASWASPTSMKVSHSVASL